MRSLRVWAIPLIGLVALAGSGCRSKDKTASAIEQIVAGKPIASVDAVVWKDVRAFYAQRDSSPAWVHDQATSSRAERTIEILQMASAHGLRPADYDTEMIAKTRQTLQDENDASADRTRELAAFDVRVTAALLRLGRDAAVGRARPQHIVRSWKAQRDVPDLPGTLSKAIAGGLRRWLDAIRPRHAEYARLQKALADLRWVREKGGWPKVSSGRYRPGQSHASVATLRQRLAAGGHLRGGAATSGSRVYDKDVEAAVRAFQELHALKATGTVDPATLAAMNVGIDQRIRQIEINLERWRWLPDDLGARHFTVNIPYYHLIAREHGRQVLDIRVVVGKPGNNTPVFSDEMTTVVFSPYWNIPESIVVGETAPAVARDPGYLARNNIEILRVSRSGARRVDPGSVDWDNPAALEDLAFRQRPGARNALGRVKFLFPNEYDVYLHDTPADSLFARTGRAFSHGCVRVEEPEALARYVLRGHDEWTAPQISEAMRSGVEKHVKLPQPIPVHLVYFTAWVDDAGGIHFQPDVYGYDARHSR